LLSSGGEIRVTTHIGDEQNWPITVSVQLCEHCLLGNILISTQFATRYCKLYVRILHTNVGGE